MVKPETIMAWYRRLVARKFDGSKYRNPIGRPPVPGEVVDLLVRMARENPGWGYDRIVGALPVWATPFGKNSSETFSGGTG